MRRLRPAEDRPDPETALTQGTLERLHRADSRLDAVRETVEDLARDYRFFHWHLEFPHIFRVPEANQVDPETGWTGGFSHYDHRFATYADATQAQLNKGTLPHLTDEQHSNPETEPLPRYWLSDSDVTDAMSNSPWTAKRDALNDHTRLLLNARIARRDRWDEEAVDEHGQWLAERLVAVWPGPDPISWP